MTLEQYASEVAAELVARNAGVPLEAVPKLERQTWPPGGPKITPQETVDAWFQMGIVAPMTADEWEKADDPSSMLRRARFHLPSERLTRFACECCRRVWDLMPGDDVRRIVAATEDYLNGQLGNDAREALFDVLTESFMAGLSNSARCAAEAAGELLELGFNAAFAASLAAAEARGLAFTAERAAQAELLRDLVGNPIRHG